MATKEQLEDKAGVWKRMAKECPEFTPAHDITDNYHAVREIVLSGSTTWAGANGFFKPQPGCNVMDVGANVGIYSAFCAVRGANVVAYEPHPVVFSLLQEMLIRTNLTNVKAVNSAVWTFTGECSFIGHVSPAEDCTRYNGGLISQGVVWTPEDKKTAKPTTCISFDEAIGDVIWDCVKMDIEGAEFEVLLAASPKALNKIKFMYVEFHPWVSQEIYDETIAKLNAIFKFIGAYPNEFGRWEAAYLFGREI